MAAQVLFAFTEGKAVQPNDRELAILDDLLEQLSKRTGDADVLMHEHLEAARYYRVGAMPDEYHFNLNLVRRLLPKIQDQELHSRITEFLRMELQPEGSSAG